MSANMLEFRLPRKVTAYFLLFGLAALVWLSVGAVVVARRVAESKSESAGLDALGAAAETIVRSYARDAKVDLQALVVAIQQKREASYCAIVSLGGQYLANSRRELAGTTASERGGTTERWGTATRTEYLDDSGRLVDEYQTALVAGDKTIGQLQLGFAKPNLWSYVSAGARYSPLALLGPIGCMAVGVVLLNRLVRPVAEIEQQLSLVAMSPSVESVPLRAVTNVGAAAFGWNRFVEQRASTSALSSLGRRIRESLDSTRRSRLDALLNSIPEGVAMTDADGKLTYTNLPMTALLGLQEASARSDDLHESPEAVGRSQGESRMAAPMAEGTAHAGSDGASMSPRLDERLIQRWKLADNDPLLAEENRDRTVVTELTRDDGGQRRVVRVARHPISVASGEMGEGHVWMIRDVTQQKLAEEMRDQFVDTATHELRTPLANIKAYAETLALADVIDVEQQKQFLNTINSEASRLARFVDDLLSVSSMELGSLSLNKQVTDMRRLFTEVIDKVQGQIDEKEQELEVVLPEKLPELELDKDKIATVLVNLLGNAVKYTAPGGRVTLRVNVTDQLLDVCVEDTGVGIAESEMEKVFDKFFRSDDPRVQQETGTGLGLALSQEVVRLHGGRIEVTSELDKGSKFSMLLPIG